MHRDLRMAANEIGCGHQYPRWAIRTETFGAQLLDSAKRYSRFLKDANLVKSHSVALEVVAHAAGLPNWHAMHALAKGLIDDFDPLVHCPRPSDGVVRMAPLASAFPLLISTSEACPPSKEEQVGFTRIAERLAPQCHCNTDAVLDVIAKMNGADNWKKLLARTPQESSLILYQFQAANDQHTFGGRFFWSNVCNALVEKQDRLYQGYFSRPPEIQIQFQNELDDVLAKRPDFLEGMLAKAEILRDNPRSFRKAGCVYANAISQADALVPEHYKGEISWGFIENRFYHRLLYGHMTWHALYGSKSKAILLARKQLRLNKEDNLGVRMWLPVLLCATGQGAAADKAMLKIAAPDNSDGQIEMIRAICHFTNGRLQQALEALLSGLFQFPALKHVLIVDFDAIHASLRSKNPDTRLVIPDVESMIHQLVTVTPVIPDLEDTFSKILIDDDIQAAEARLASVFNAARLAHSVDGFSSWRNDIKVTALRLSNQKLGIAEIA